MNIALSSKPTGGLEPVKLTTEAYLDMAGFLNVRFEKTELLDGLLYEMPADGALTRRWDSTLARWLIGHVGDDVALVSHQTLPLSEYWAPSPDHYLFPASVGHERVTGADALLIIEVSDTTLAYDLGGKAAAYAEHGVREYWVIDPNGRRIFVHRLGPDGGYGEPRRVEFDERADALLVPGLALRLADLKGIG